MHKIVSLGIAALLAFLGVAVVTPTAALAAAEQQIGLVTGRTGGVGENDPLVTVSLDGTTFVPAVIADPHPSYDVIAGTQWVTVAGGEYATARYRLPFTLPAGATAPSLVADVHADNVAEVQLNGTSLGTQSSSGDVANFQNPPEQFSTVNGELFVTGENHLDVLVTDQAPPTGLDLSAVVRYTPAGGGDTPPPPTISIADTTVDEGDSGAPVAQLTVAIDPPAPTATSVTVSTTDGTASGTADYQHRDPFVVAFDASQTTATISIPIVPDTALEPDETFSVVLSAPTGGLTIGDGTAQVTIVDDDDLSVSIGAGSGTEGDTVVLPITFSSPALESGSVLATTSDGSALQPGDYTAAVGRLVAWEAGATGASVAIATTEDGVTESAEKFSVELTDPQGAVIGTASAKGTIVDDDPAPGKLDVTGSRTSEGAGPMVFTVRTDVVQNVPVSFTFFTTRNGSASEGGDFTAVTGRFTLPAGNASVGIPVPLVNDPFYETNETVAVRIVNPSSGAIGNADAVGTIVNDDPLPVVSIADTYATEGDPGAGGVLDYAVSLTAAQHADFTVDAYISGGTANAAHTAADTGPFTHTITIPAGQRIGHVLVPIVGDVVDELTETVKVTLSKPRLAGRDHGRIDRPTGVGDIVDDDPRAPRAAISDASVVEGDPGSGGVLSFIVSIGDAQKVPVTVRLSTITRTASASDLARGAQDLTFPVGTRSMVAEVLVAGDFTDELTETVEVSISGVGLGGTVVRSPATGTIQDDDPRPPGWAVSNASVVEGDPGAGGVLRFGISFSDVQKRPVSIAYATSAGTAQSGDFQAVSGRVTVPTGSRNAIVEVPVTGDLEIEGDETVRLVLSAPSVGTISRSPGIGTINDDDRYPVVSIDDGSGLEGTTLDGSAGFLVRLDRPSATAVEVDFATRLDGKVAGAASGNDLIQAAGTLTFAPGETERLVVVTLEGDAVAEVDEHFTVRITDARGAKLGDTTAVGTIVNDDGSAEG